jgi:hypothetical protein
MPSAPFRPPIFVEIPAALRRVTFFVCEATLQQVFFFIYLPFIINLNCHNNEDRISHVSFDLALMYEW